MLNKVTLIGRLGKDPELKYSQAGAPVARFSIATDESYVDREGTKVDRTEWHNIVVFQRQAETCSNYLHKGSLVYLEGSLQTRKWQDAQGQDRYTTEIRANRVIFLDKKGSQGSDDYSPSSPSSSSSSSSKKNSYDDEDLGPAFPSEASQIDDMPF